MSQKDDKRTSEKEEKDVVYTFQCTQELRNQISKKGGAERFDGI